MRKREFRINENQLLKEEHFPVKFIFNMVSDDRFIRTVKGVSQGRGFGENYGACVFWNDLDEYDRSNIDTYEGAEFGLHSGEEVTINYVELYYYLKLVCSKFIADYPEQKVQTESLLNDYKERFLNY